MGVILNISISRVNQSHEKRDQNVYFDLWRFQSDWIIEIPTTNKNRNQYGEYYIFPLCVVAHIFCSVWLELQPITLLNIIRYIMISGAHIKKDRDMVFNPKGCFSFRYVDHFSQQITFLYMTHVMLLWYFYDAIQLCTGPIKTPSTRSKSAPSRSLWYTNIKSQYSIIGVLVIYVVWTWIIKQAPSPVTVCMLPSNNTFWDRGNSFSASGDHSIWYRQITLVCV